MQSLHVPPGLVSLALVLLLPVVDACRLGLVQVMPCRVACWCSGLGSRVRLSLLAVYCIGGGRCPACGLLAAVWWGLLWLWLRLRGGDALRLGRLVQVAGLLAPAGAGGGVAPALCRAPSGQNKKRLQPCGLCLCGALWALLFLFWYRFPFWLFVACGGFWGLFWLIDFRAVCAACQVVNRAIQAFCNIKKNFD